MRLVSIGRSSIAATEPPISRNVPDRPLQQPHQRPRRRRLDRPLELGDNRLRGARPSCALAIVEEPARAQSPIHLRAQLRQTVRAASRDQPHLALDVRVTVDRRRDDLAQLVVGQAGDQLLDRGPGSRAQVYGASASRLISSRGVMTVAPMSCSSSRSRSPVTSASTRVARASATR